MTLDVFTGRMGVRDPDWLDITRKGNDERMRKARCSGERGVELWGHRGVGDIFAPSGQLLRTYLNVRYRSGRLTDGEWSTYRERYLQEMRTSYMTNRDQWDEVLGWNRVVLLCFCRDPEHCHRTVLARDVLARLGANILGELS